MSDIVADLRRAQINTDRAWEGFGLTVHTLFADAADEIERLRSVVRKVTDCIVRDEDVRWEFTDAEREAFYRADDEQ